MSCRRRRLHGSRRAVILGRGGGGWFSTIGYRASTPYPRIFKNGSVAVGAGGGGGLQGILRCTWDPGGWGILIADTQGRWICILGDLKKGGG